MPIQADCPRCHARLEVDDKHTGKMARCPECNQQFKLPQHPQETTSDSPLSAAVPPLSSTPHVPSTSHLPGTPPELFFLRSADQKIYGPIEKSVLENWVTQGRVSSGCDLRQSTSDPWQSAENFYPALNLPESLAAGNPFGQTEKAKSSPTKPGTPTTPHRSTLILFSGLLGALLICPLFCIMAWTLGSMDLLEMEAGRMDRAGYQRTRIGYFLGIGSSLVWLLLLISCLFYLAFTNIF